VDHLITPGGVSEEDVRKIRAFFAEKMLLWEDVISHAATILSQLTHYTSIVLGPETFHTTLKHFQLVPLNDTSAVAIIVTNTGHVEHRTMAIPEGIDLSELNKVVNLLNDKLSGLPFYRVKSVLHSEVARELQRYVDRCEEILKVLEESLTDNKDPRVFLSGAANMLTQPEFKDVDKAKMILDTLEETSSLARLIQSESSGIQVRIGTENAIEAINQCSLITATFMVDGQSLGTVGILGPTRMDYGKVIGLLEYFSSDFASLFAHKIK
jgi:heat-inducible transcriptional repressor